ncbi:MAG: hypothetical protein WBV94_30705 [Blastocatellia bacterium]
MPTLYILSEELTNVANSMPMPLVLAMYALSIAIFILAILLAIKTIGLRKRVENKYKDNADILKTWKRGLSLVTSFEDEEVLNGLDLLHVLNEAQKKFWDRHVFEILMEHKNQRIATKAKFIYDKLAPSTTETPAPVIDRD